MTVLTQYQLVLASIPKRMQSIAGGIKVAVEAFKPEADLLAMIEGNRTGNFVSADPQCILQPHTDISF